MNDQVKKGEVLIELDDTKLKASVERAKASLDLSKATLAESQATLKEAKAKLSRLQEVRRLSGGKSPSKTELMLRRLWLLKLRLLFKVLKQKSWIVSRR